MAELIWSNAAVSDLENIYDFIARDSRQYARHQVEKIQLAVMRLQQHPESGRHIPEFPHLPHREIIVDNYRVVYRYIAENEKVLIVTVVHGRRLLPEGI